MSDPVKNAEVEDVLSSIRRLVSEDKRPLQALKPAPQNDRLVLTPALRVQEEVSDVEAEAEDAQEALIAEEAAVDHATAVADLAENYDDDPYSFDDDQDKDGDTSALLVLTDPQQIDADGEGDAPDVSADVDNGEEDKAATLSAKIAALETAIGDISDEWEPDSAGQDAYAGSEPETMVWEDAVDTDQQDEEASADQNPVEIDASDVEEVSDSDDDSDDGYVEDTPAAEAELDEDDIVARALAEEPVQQEDAEDAVAGFSINAEDQLLDEDTLREMISEIVQSELQGALGERITRNVRRLVRREIHRALTARDLD